MWLDHRGEPIQANLGGDASRSSYRAGSTSSQEMAAFRPSLTSADGAVRPARNLALSRTRYLTGNDPHAAAGVKRLVDMLIGAGLRLVAKPDSRALGITEEQAREIRGRIEAEWRVATQDPRFLFDHERKVSLNGRLRQLGRTWTVAGECCVIMRWREKDLPGARYRTNVQAIDPDRLSTPAGMMESVRLRNGIEFDEDAAATAFHVRDAHPADWLAGARTTSWTRIPRETDWGRPIFIHGFEPEREGLTRAITNFAPLMQRLKMIGQHADIEVANATANALFAAFVKSNMGLQDATATMNVAARDSRHDWANRRNRYWMENPATLGGVRIPVLPIGDELVMNNAPRQTAAFETFERTFLRSIASALGLSYEQLAMDWSQTNYSSARAALNEVWRGVRRDFAAFVEQVVTPIYLCFLEEAFDRYVELPKGAPAFWDMPAAWAACRWIGPARGYVDPVKEAQASNLRIDGLISTLEAENAEQGLDWEETIEQLAYEQQLMAEKGVRRVSATMVTADETPPEDKPKSEQQA